MNGLKPVLLPDEAASLLKNGARIMVGGFGLVGCPITLVHAIDRMGINNLEIISNNLGEPGRGLGVLVQKKKVRKGIGSYFTSNPDVVEAYLRKELEIELLPQGTLAEAIRAGGAGIPAFYTPVGAGTDLTKGKEEKVFDDKKYILQRSLISEFSLIKAHKADNLGNLTYIKSARNFNPAMATAGRIVIAEVDEIVEVGELDPEAIITPHLYVDYLVLKEE